MSIIDLIVVFLACDRLTHLLVYEAAPFGIAQHLRNLLGASEERCIEQHQNSRITNALCCVSCASIWAAAAICAAWVYVPVIVWAFAASGAVVLVNRYL
jgi:hypothetical protein